MVKSIRILKPIVFSSFKRNELSGIQSGAPIDITAIDAKGSPKNRTQRNSIVLRDVEYIIEAAIFMSEANIQKVKERDKKEARKPCEPIGYVKFSSFARFSSSCVTGKNSHENSRVPR